MQNKMKKISTRSSHIQTTYDLSHTLNLKKKNNRALTSSLCHHIAAENHLNRVQFSALIRHDLNHLDHPA